MPEWEIHNFHNGPNRIRFPVNLCNMESDQACFRLDNNVSVCLSVCSRPCSCVYSCVLVDTRVFIPFGSDLTTQTEFDSFQPGRIELFSIPSPVITFANASHSFCAVVSLFFRQLPEISYNFPVYAFMNAVRHVKSYATHSVSEVRRAHWIFHPVYCVVIYFLQISTGC